MLFDFRMWWTGKFRVTYQLQMGEPVLDRRKDMMLDHREHMVLEYRIHMALDHQNHMALDHQNHMVLDQGSHTVDYDSLKGSPLRSRSWTAEGGFGCWG